MNHSRSKRVKQGYQIELTTGKEIFFKITLVLRKTNYTKARA